KSEPAVCQARTATPEMIAAAGCTPPPMARITPIAVSTIAMRCWPISIARTVATATAEPDGSVRVSGRCTRFMIRFSQAGVRLPWPPDASIGEAEDRGHDHGAHDEGVDQHADADDEAELPERDQREHAERG